MAIESCWRIARDWHRAATVWRGCEKPRPPWRAGLIGGILVLVITRVAFADSISPFVWFWPGIVSVTFVYALPASLLAAFVERPYVARAGLSQRPLTFSLRANALSTVVGLMLIPIGEPALYIIGPLWCLAAFAISCVVEILYYCRFNESLAKGPIIAGNVVSSGLLMLLPPIAFGLRSTYGFLADFVEPHQTWLCWTADLSSVVLFLSSFAVPVKTQEMSGETALDQDAATDRPCP